MKEVERMEGITASLQTAVTRLVAEWAIKNASPKITVAEVKTLTDDVAYLIGQTCKTVYDLGKVHAEKKASASADLGPIRGPLGPKGPRGPQGYWQDPDEGVDPGL